MNEFKIGKAGEHLVISDILSKGYDCFIAGEGLPYDVVFDYKGKLIKIQVKTSEKIRSNNLYIYSFLNGKSKNRKTYKKNEIDLFAVVSLSTKEVGYVLFENSNTILQVRETSKKGEYSSDISDEILKLYNQGKKYSEIAKILNKHPSNVRSSIVNRKKTKRGIYFEDLKFENIINNIC